MTIFCEFIPTIYYYPPFDIYLLITVLFFLFPVTTLINFLPSGLQSHVHNLRGEDHPDNQHGRARHAALPHRHPVPVQRGGGPGGDGAAATD